MLSHHDITRAYRDAGAFNALVNLYGFMDDGVFLTKSGDVGMFVAWRGVDYEGLDATERDLVARRFERSLRLFDERYRIYQYLIKERVEAIVSAPSRSPKADVLIS